MHVALDRELGDRQLGGISRLRAPPTISFSCDLRAAATQARVAALRPFTRAARRQVEVDQHDLRAAAARTGCLAHARDADGLDLALSREHPVAAVLDVVQGVGSYDPRLDHDRLPDRAFSVGSYARA